MMPDAYSGASSSDLNSGTGFPGFGEGAPLDLSGLTSAAEAAVVDRLRDGSFAAWADTAAGIGYCTHPVRLTGTSTILDGRTGEVLDVFTSRQAPLGVVYRPCGNRRAEVCPSCSRTYARDQFAMIRAGLAGGKTVPDSVAANPLLFVTFTPPSFGSVHGPRPRAGQKTGGRCRPRDRPQFCPHGRPTGCMQVHTADDPHTAPRSVPTATTGPAPSSGSGGHPRCGDAPPSPCAGSWRSCWGCRRSD